MTKQGFLFLLVGLLLGVSAGWWLQEMNHIDACLDAGGRWQYSGGYCEGIEV